MYVLCIVYIYIPSREIMQNTQGIAGHFSAEESQRSTRKKSGCPWHKNAILQSFLARDTLIDGKSPIVRKMSNLSYSMYYP